jgi:hypothetical protein
MVVVDANAVERDATALAVQDVGGIDQIGFQSRRRRHHLESRARLEGIGHHTISPLRGFEMSKSIGVERRQRGHGQDGAAARVEDDCRSPACLALLHCPRQLSLDNVLNRHVDCQIEISARLGIPKRERR